MGSLAFLLTVFLLVNFQLKADFLGKRQVALMDAAAQGEGALVYIDQMVKLSLVEAWGSTHKGRTREYVFFEECSVSTTAFDACKREFETAFGLKFKNHLKTFNEVHSQNLELDHFEIEITSERAPPTEPAGKLGGLKIVGKAKEKIELETRSPEIGTIKYSIKPNFQMIVSLEELNLLK